MLYKDDIDPWSKSKLANKLSAELRELMIVCRENLHHAQKLQKRANNKATKLKSYASGNKIWLNGKYIKTKHNRKLEANFFGLFRVLHLVKKQAYKLELSRKWRIHDIFHVLPLKQNTIKKGWMDKKVRQIEFNIGNNDNGEYKVKAIWDSVVYARESQSGHLPSLYYLVSWKRYPEEENTWELTSAVHHLRKLISLFHKDHPDKLTAISFATDTAPPMDKLIVKPIELLK